MPREEAVQGHLTHRPNCSAALCTPSRGWKDLPEPSTRRAFTGAYPVASRVATLCAPRRPVLWSSLPTTRVALSPGPNIWSWVLLGGRACLLNGPGWLGVTSVPPCYATLRYTMLCLNFLSGCPANPSELRGAPALKGSRGELRKS